MLVSPGAGLQKLESKPKGAQAPDQRTRYADKSQYATYGLTGGAPRPSMG